MTSDDKQQDRERVQNAFNLSVAAVGSQVGCMTTIIILIALVIGLWLDRVFSTKPMFTILFTIGSIPFTLVAMFWVVRRSTANLISTSKPKTKGSEEEADRGKTS